MEITYLERPATRTLPNRPALPPGVPVFRRSADSAQLGVDPRRSVVLDGLTPPLLSALHELDGRHRIDELAALVAQRGGRPHDLHGLLSELAAHGLLVDAAGTGTDPLPGWLRPDAVAWTMGTGRPGDRALHARRNSAVTVDGGGRMGVAIACALAAAGVGRVDVRADGVVGPADVGTGYTHADLGRSRADAARDAVARHAPIADGRPGAPVVPAARTASSRSGRSAKPDLVVLADTVLPDPGRAAELRAGGVPHLPVQALGGHGAVGPLVLPGRTGCLRCADLHRTTADPHWPTLSAQLCRRPQEADLCTTLAVAALAAGQVVHALGWADAARWAPPVWGAVVELDSLRGVLNRSRCTPHPDCGCGAV